MDAHDDAVHGVIDLKRGLSNLNDKIHRPPLHHVHGRVLTDPRENGRHALILMNTRPQEKTSDSVYLRYAFRLLGTRASVFPGTILDDWGAEISGIKVYRWIRENGDAFPRAEIFGKNIDGVAEQYFIRELDLTMKIRCYAYASRDEELKKGRAIQNILFINPEAAAPIKRRRPAQLRRPVRGTRITYWEIPPLAADETFDFSQIDLEE